MSQSKLGSFLESVNAAAFAAPTAMLLHKATIVVAGDNMLNENQDLYVFLTWVTFFLHSIAWKFVLRRVYEYYGYKLDPKYIYYRLKSIIA